MERYKACVQNLQRLISGLSTTNVRFLYFLANDLVKPRVTGRMKEMKVGKHAFYVSPGMSQNTCYVYKRSVVKYMLTVPDTNDNVVQRLVLDDSDNVYHGDHVTFGCIVNKKRDIIIKTHITRYRNESLNDHFEIDRSVHECNFTWKADKLESAKVFASVKCEKINGGYTQDTVKHVYDDAFQSVVYKLSIITCESTTPSAPLQSAGAPSQRTGAPRIVSPSDVERPEFSVFLGSEFLKRLPYLPELEDVKVIFGKGRIIVTADYRASMRYVYHLDGVITFRAFRGWYREARGRRPGIRQVECLQRFRSDVITLMNVT